MVQLLRFLNDWVVFHAKSRGPNSCFLKAPLIEVVARRVPWRFVQPPNALRLGRLGSWDALDGLKPVDTWKGHLKTDSNSFWCHHEIPWIPMNSQEIPWKKWYLIKVHSRSHNLETFAKVPLCLSAAAGSDALRRQKDEAPGWPWRPGRPGRQKIPWLTIPIETGKTMKGYAMLCRCNHILKTIKYWKHEKSSRTCWSIFKKIGKWEPETHG